MDQSFTSDDNGRGHRGDDDDDDPKVVDPSRSSDSDHRSRAAEGEHLDDENDATDDLSSRNDISLLDFLKVAFSDGQDGTFRTNAKLGDIIDGIYQSEFRDYSIGSVFELYKNNAKRRRRDESFDGNDGDGNVGIDGINQGGGGMHGGGGGGGNSTSSIRTDGVNEKERSGLKSLADDEDCDDGGVTDLSNLSGVFNKYINNNDDVSYKTPANHKSIKKVRLSSSLMNQSIVVNEDGDNNNHNNNNNNNNSSSSSSSININSNDIDNYNNDDDEEEDNNKKNNNKIDNQQDKRDSKRSSGASSSVLSAPSSTSSTHTSVPSFGRTPDSFTSTSPQLRKHHVDTDAAYPVWLRRYHASLGLNDSNNNSDSKISNKNNNSNNNSNNFGDGVVADGGGDEDMMTASNNNSFSEKIEKQADERRDRSDSNKSEEDVIFDMPDDDFHEKFIKKTIHVFDGEEEENEDNNDAGNDAGNDTGNSNNNNNSCNNINNTNNNNDDDDYGDDSRGSGISSNKNIRFNTTMDDLEFSVDVGGDGNDDSSDNDSRFDEKGDPSFKHHVYSNPIEISDEDSIDNNVGLAQNYNKNASNSSNASKRPDIRDMKFTPAKSKSSQPSAFVDLTGDDEDNNNTMDISGIGGDGATSNRTPSPEVVPIYASPSRKKDLNNSKRTDAAANVKMEVPPALHNSKGYRASIISETVDSELQSFIDAGKASYGTDDFHGALFSFSSALSVAPMGHPSLHMILSHRSATLFMLNQFSECINDCNRALDLDPRLYKILVRKGKAYLRQGELEHASQTFRSVGQIENISPRHMNDYLTTQVEVESKLKEIEKIKENVLKATYLEKQGKFYEVLELTEDILVLCTHFHAIAIMKAKCLLQLKHYNESKTHIEIYLSKSSLSLRSKYAHLNAPQRPPRLDQLLWKVHPIRKAIDIDISGVVDAMLCAGPDLCFLYKWALMNIDESVACSSDHMDKMFAILTALEPCLGSSINDDNGWSWVPVERSCIKDLIESKNQGDRMYSQGRYHEAVHYYNECLKSEDKMRASGWMSTLFMNRAAAFMALHRFDDVIVDCDKALRQSNKCFKAFLRRARAKKAKKDYSECLKDYESYLKEIPVDMAKVREEMDATILEKRNFEAEMLRRSKQDSNGAASAPAAGGNGGFKFAGNPFSSSQFGGKVPEGFYGNTSSYGFPPPQSQGQQQQAKPTSAPNRNPPPGNTNRPNYNRNKFDFNFDDIKFPKTSDTYQYNNQSNQFNSRPRQFGNSSSSSSQQQQSSSSSSFVPLSKEKDLYKALGVAPNASERDIKVSYRKLALKYHPDKNKDPGADDNFKAVCTAYQTLSDSSTRRQYDLTRRL